MKSLHIFSKLILATALTFGSVGCDKLLDIEPKQSIDAATGLSSEEAVNAAVIGVFDLMQPTRYYGRDLVAVGEALADNGRATNKSGRLNSEYLNAINNHFGTTASGSSTVWSNSYQAINQLNLILEALPKVDKMPEANKNAVEGQVKFLRALIYHNLVKIWGYDPKAKIDQYDRGGVPLLLTGTLDYGQVTKPSRAAVADIYKQIYADLTDAIAKLEKTAVTRAPFYPTKGAAQALFSRVALHNGDYDTVIKQATDAIGSGAAKFAAKDAYVAGWRAAQHPESFYEIKYITAENVGVNEALQTTYTTLVELGNRTKTGGFGDLVPTDGLLADMTIAKVDKAKATFERGADIRAQLYEFGTAGRGTAEIECTKFLGKNTGVNLDNVPVIRISEVILNRAEAYAAQGKATEALKDLNQIRERAGLTAQVATIANDALIADVLTQRRVELAFEGDRWFTLKRLGRDIVKTAPAATLPFTDYRILPPVPVRETQSNPNLKQNFGY
jgi:starch-binding outer membrane protein, SusD/RagB family